MAYIFLDTYKYKSNCDNNGLSLESSNGDYPVTGSVGLTRKDFLQPTMHEMSSSAIIC